jgi:hypothetical protein
MIQSVASLSSRAGNGNTGRQSLADLVLSQKSSRAEEAPSMLEILPQAGLNLEYEREEFT